VKREGISSKMAYVLGPAVIFTYLLMIMGTFVTSTGSGLACPDWPLCYGSVKPPLELSIWFEWGHRLLGGVTGLLIFTSTILVWRKYKGVPRFLTSLIVVLLLLGVLLGGIIVLVEAPLLNSLTHTAIISSHLIISTLVLICLIFTFRYVCKGRAVVTGGYYPLLLCVVYLQVVLGIIVRYSGASMACPDLTLCLGQVIPLAYVDYTVLLQFSHRIGALLVVFFTLANLYTAFNEREDENETIMARRVFTAFVTLGLVILQATVGLTLIGTQLFLPVVILHAAVGFLLLGWLAYQSMPYLFSMADREVEVL
jgi:cytochrome c oxidase assembly protein subunit 15